MRRADRRATAARRPLRACGGLTAEPIPGSWLTVNPGRGQTATA